MSDKKSILIVEDEFLIAMDLETYLEDSGYDIVGPVGTVAQAMAKIDTNIIHAAILDFNLKDGTSEPIARKLIEKTVGVIFLSGDNLEARGDEFANCLTLSKPVSFQDLKALLENLLQ